MNIIIKKIIVNRKPLFCVEYPIKNSGIKTLDKGACGKMSHSGGEGKWSFGGMVPDERCLFEVEE